MVERKEYLEQLIGWKEEQVIKVVTGIRRCGKSTLLMQYQAWLRENGALDAQIVSVNFEELEYEELLDYKKLYAYLKERLVAGKTTYIFLDEIQKVPDFEKVVDSLYVKPNVLQARTHICSPVIWQHSRPGAMWRFGCCRSHFKSSLPSQSWMPSAVLQNI